MARLMLLVMGTGSHCVDSKSTTLVLQMSALVGSTRMAKLGGTRISIQLLVSPIVLTLSA